MYGTLKKILSKFIFSLFYYPRKEVKIMYNTVKNSNSEYIVSLLSKQKKYFESGATLDVNFRITMLKKLRDTIEKYENEIAEALKTDLGKNTFESYMCETGLTIFLRANFFTFLIIKLISQMVWTPPMQFASTSFKKASPYGNTLIMSPWNYPFMLTLEPLADALAAGNTAIVKPSAYSPATSAIIKKIIGE